jgi:hypothetical protein
MRRSRFDYTAWIEPPFPWLGLSIGFGTGLILLPALAWLGFELLDQSLESYTP